MIVPKMRPPLKTLCQPEEISIVALAVPPKTWSPVPPLKVMPLMRPPDETGFRKPVPIVPADQAADGTAAA